MLAPDPDRRWTYKDYCAWPEGERWELIDGVAYAMVPAPSRWHQEASSDLLYLFRRALEGKPRKVYAAPFDVRLGPAEADDDDITTVVQPDLMVFCKPERLDDKGAHGAPDLAVEILSPSNPQHDTLRKRKLYEQHGVREYWIVDTANRRIYRMNLEGGRFGDPVEAGNGETLQSALFPEIRADIDALFPPPPPAPHP